MNMQMEVKLVFPQDGKEDNRAAPRRDRMCMSPDNRSALLSVAQVVRRRNSASWFQRRWVREEVLYRHLPLWETLPCTVFRGCKIFPLRFCILESFLSDPWQTELGAGVGGG